jgi:abhydrolase domain-containing protein 6
VIGGRLYDTVVAAEARMSRLSRARTTCVTNGAAETASFYAGGPTQGPVVVLLHGFSSDSAVWIRFARYLTPSYRVVIPDLPGHGETGFVSGRGYSAPRQAAWLAEFLDAMGIEAVHLLGNSMGGFIAATFARACPGRTRSLGLCDASGVSGSVASEMDVLLRRGRNPFLLERVEDFGSFYQMTMSRPPFIPRAVLREKARHYVRRREELAEIFADQHGRDQLDEQLAQITAPTWVVWGDEDRLVDRSVAQTWVAGLPDVRLTRYPDLGHMPMLEAPRRCATDYHAFLTHASMSASSDAARRRDRS